MWELESTDPDANMDSLGEEEALSEVVDLVGGDVRKMGGNGILRSETGGQ